MHPFFMRKLKKTNVKKYEYMNRMLLSATVILSGAEGSCVVKEQYRVGY